MCLVYMHTLLVSDCSVYKSCQCIIRHAKNLQWLMYEVELLSVLTCGFEFIVYADNST